MREEGYYWVKFAGQWTVAHYYPAYAEWYVIGNTMVQRDHSFQEIDERKIVRDGK